MIFFCFCICVNRLMFGYMRRKLVHDMHNSLDPTRDSNVVVQRLVLAVSL